MQKIFPATRPQWYNLKMKEMSKHSLQSGIEVKKNKNIKQARKKMWLVAFDWSIFWSYLIGKKRWSNYRIPGHRIYICRCALKNEVYNNSCFLMQWHVNEVAGYLPSPSEEKTTFFHSRPAENFSMCYLLSRSSNDTWGTVLTRS